LPVCARKVLQEVREEFKYLQERRSCEVHLRMCCMTQGIDDTKAGGVAQVLEHLPSKCEALCSNPTTTKKKRSSPGSPYLMGNLSVSLLIFLSSLS
jgi:hypothetical protein